MQKSVHTSEYRALRAELKRARLGAGLSQRGLASRLEVPHSWIAKVESGERRIDLVEFCRFISACDGDPATAFARLMHEFARPRSKPAKTGVRR